MFKSLLSLILLVAASFSLVGCATDSGSNGAWAPGGAGRRGMIGAGGGAAAGAIIGGGRGAGAGAIIGGLVGAGTAR